MELQHEPIRYTLGRVPLALSVGRRREIAREIGCRTWDRHPLSCRARQREVKAWVAGWVGAEDAVDWVVEATRAEAVVGQVER